MIYLTRENPNFQKPQFTYFFLIDACIGEPKKPTCSPRFFVKPNQIRRGVFLRHGGCNFLASKVDFLGPFTKLPAESYEFALKVLENQPKLV